MVDVEHLAHGADTVGRIHISADFLVVVEPPVVPILVPERIEVVAVSAFHMDNFAEEPALGHLERRHLKEVVDAVLQHHAVFAGLFGLVDQAPDLVHVEGCGHLDGHMLAAFHGIHGNRIMVEPVGADVHQIDVSLLTEAAPGLLLATVGTCRNRFSFFADELLARFDTVGKKVAQGHDLGTGNLDKTTHSLTAAHAQAHNTDVDGFDRFGRQAQDILLPRRPGRNRCLDDVLNRLLLAATSRQQGQRRKNQE